MQWRVPREGRTWGVGILLVSLACGIAGCGGSGGSRFSMQSSRPRPPSDVYVSRLRLFQCLPPQGWRVQEEDASGKDGPVSKTYLYPPGDDQNALAIDARRIAHPPTMEAWLETSLRELKQGGYRIESQQWGTTAGRRSFTLTISRPPEWAEATSFQLPDGTAISVGGSPEVSSRGKYARDLKAFLESIGPP